MLLIFAAATHAATMVGRDIRITVDPLPNGMGGNATQHGYMDYRVRVENLSTTDAHRVVLRLPASSYGGGDRLRDCTRTIIVEPQTAQVVSLLQPPLVMQGNGLEVRVPGRTEVIQSVNIVEHAAGWAFHGSSGTPTFVLSSRSIDASFRGRAQSTHVGSYQPQVLESQLDVDQWSADWLSYTVYDGVAVTARDLAGMPAEVKRALRRYVEAGGSLVVFGAWRPDADWSVVPRHDATRAHYFMGFGELRVIGETDPRKVAATDYNKISQMWAATATPQRNVKDVEQANRDFEVVEDLGVPAKGLLLLMITFAVVIGPVNLWVLAKKRRRMWLLWTVPAISLLFCAAVWGYAVVAEGWAGRERAEGLTLLDERNATATTLGMVAFYSPLTPGGGLHFERDTELSPQINRNSYSGGRARTIDWTNDQHLRSGWVVARVPAHFRVRKSDPTQRARINPTITDGRLAAVNGLGADVKSITLADADGHIHEAGPTLAGQPFAFTRTNRTAGGQPNALRQVFAQDWPVWPVKHFGVSARRDAYLRPNTYIAVIETNPFIESGFGDTDTRRATAVVYGVFDPPAATGTTEP